MNGVSALVALMVASCATSPPQPAGPKPDSTRTAQLAGGAAYQFRWYASGPWAVHSIAVQPKQCGVGFRTIKAGSSMIGRERTSVMAARAADSVRVLAAINADFFSFDPPGVSEGPQIAGGVLLKSEGHHREAIEDRRLRLQPVFAIDRNGKPIIVHTRMRGTVQVGEQTLPLAGVNVRPRHDSAFVYTPFWGDATPADSVALEFVIRDGAVVRVDTSASGVAIPPNGSVVMVRGAARDRVRNIREGSRVTWSAHYPEVPNAREMIGGYPMLLVRGKHVHHDEIGLRPAFADRRHPRAAIGVDRRGRVWIVAVDGRQPEHSDGMTLQEFGDFLLAHGISDAINLDGGGSTTMLVGGRIANRPSDSNGERAVANAVLVIDQAGSASCSRNR
jgi:hypothetical protein